MNIPGNGRPDSGGDGPEEDGGGDGGEGDAEGDGAMASSPLVSFVMDICDIT